MPWDSTVSGNKNIHQCAMNSDIQNRLLTPSEKSKQIKTTVSECFARSVTGSICWYNLLHETAHCPGWPVQNRHPQRDLRVLLLVLVCVCVCVCTAHLSTVVITIQSADRDGAALGDTHRSVGETYSPQTQN